MNLGTDNVNDITNHAVIFLYRKISIEILKSCMVASDKHFEFSNIFQCGLTGSQ